MELNRIIRYVLQCLEHLDDWAYLETHPLAEILGLGEQREGRSNALRRVLVEAIQALRPGPEVPTTSLAWRKYRYLYLRFIQGWLPREVATDLGVSVRQSRRYLREALLAIARSLRERVPDAFVLPNAASSSDGPERWVDESVEDAVDREVARVATVEPKSLVSIEEVLESVMDTLAPLIEHCGVTVQQAGLAGLPPVRLDRAILRQSFLALLAQVLDRGATTVTFLAGLEPNESVVEVMIRCRFPGHAPALCECLVADEQWHVAAHLLRYQGGRLTGTVRDEQTIDLTLALPLGSEVTVLIIEDNADTVHLYRRYLTGRPYRVLAAASAPEILARLDEARPAVILLDVLMPTQDGWEILRLLKRHPSVARIPVVVCSVLRERNLALALGADDFLAKPIDRVTLLRILERYVGPGPSERPSSSGGIA